jgi:peptidoglycan/LPS O-acetylase OafA/YrhL
MKYRNEIDGLRAIAVVPVILFHAGFKTFSGGFVGVDVFFVISGYLITTLILEEKQKGEFSLSSFYERRIRRILPALFVVMLTCLPFAWAWMPPADLKDFSESLAAVVTFLSNVLFWSEAGYFDTGSELKPLLHTWSLAVEEQFYILLPLLIWLGWQHGKLRRLWLIPTIWIFSFIFSEWQATNFPDAAFFLVFARFWELLTGAGAAVILLNRLDLERPLWLKPNSFFCQFSSSAGLLMILLPIFLFNESTVFPGISAIPPVIGTTLIILFASPSTLVGSLLCLRPFVGIGLISYSAYLWHQPLFAFARYHEVGVWHQTLFLLLVASSLALAWATYALVERPFRNKAHFSRRQIFCFAFVVSLIFLVLGIFGHKSKGFIKYRGNEQIQSLLNSARRDSDAPDCSTGGRDYRKPANSCILGKAPARIAVLGDSHASIVAYRTAVALEAYGTGLRQLSFAGCDPTYGRTNVNSACAQWTKEAVEFILSSPQIDTVIVVYRMNTHLFGGHHHVYPKQPDFVDKHLREDRWNSFLKTIHDLQKSGKHVVVLLPIPEVRRRIADLIFLDQHLGTQIAGVSRSWWETRNEFVRQHIYEFPEGTLVIDPTDLYCDDQECWAVKGGESLYFDHNHLSRAGMLPLARLIVNCMEKNGFLSGDFRLQTAGICSEK